MLGIGNLEGDRPDRKQLLVLVIDADTASPCV
jgi:hypothetical protein